MIYLIEALLPRRMGSFALLMMGGLAYLLGCLLSEPGNPGFLLLLAALLGMWLGAWCQDLHLFAGAHRIPRFASRMLSAYLTVFAVIALITTMLMLANREMLVVLSVLLTTIVLATALTLVIRQYWFVPALFVCWSLMPKTSDATRETVANLLSMPASSLVAGLVFLLSLIWLFFLLSKPTSHTRDSLRSWFYDNPRGNRKGITGAYGVNWLTHWKLAVLLIAATITLLHFFDTRHTAISIMWVLILIATPAQSLGRAVCSAPRSWLAGAFSSRRDMSIKLFTSLLGSSFVYGIAALGTFFIANAINASLPPNFLLIVLAAFIAGALALGLISSFGENLSTQRQSFGRSMLLVLVMPGILLLADFEVFYLQLVIALMAAPAAYFLHKGHQRVSNLEFNTY